MSAQEHRYLLGQKRTLDKLLAGMPSDSGITRQSLVWQREKMVKKLEKYEGLDPLRVDKESFVGRFLGFFPHSQQAEFAIEDTGKVINAKVKLEDPSGTTPVSEVLGQPIEILVHLWEPVRERHQYTIVGYHRIDSDNTEPSP